MILASGQKENMHLHPEKEKSQIWNTKLKPTMVQFSMFRFGLN